MGNHCSNISKDINQCKNYILDKVTAQINNFYRWYRDNMREDVSDSPDSGTELVEISIDTFTASCEAGAVPVIPKESSPRFDNEWAVIDEPTII